MEAKKAPWNKGRLIGQKPPLKPKDIWTIRINLQNSHAVRDLAMFNLAIDSKLRGDYRVFEMRKNVLRATLGQLQGFRAT